MPACEECAVCGAADRSTAPQTAHARLSGHTHVVHTNDFTPLYAVIYINWCALIIQAQWVGSAEWIFWSSWYAKVEEVRKSLGQMLSGNG